MQLDIFKYLDLVCRRTEFNDQALSKIFQITGEIETCDFEPPDGATLETLDKHWQNY